MTEPAMQTMEPPVDWEQHDPEEWTVVRREDLETLIARIETEQARAGLAEKNLAWKIEMLSDIEVGQDIIDATDRYEKAEAENEQLRALLADAFEIDDQGQVCSVHNGYEPISAEDQDRYLALLDAGSRESPPERR